MSNNTDQLLQTLIEGQNRSIEVQNKLSDKIGGLTTKLENYITKHDGLEETVKRSFKRLDEQEKRINELEKFQAAADPVIASIRALNNQLLARLMFMMLGTIGAVALIMYVVQSGGVN